MVQFIEEERKGLHGSSFSPSLKSIINKIFNHLWKTIFHFLITLIKSNVKRLLSSRSEMKETQTKLAFLLNNNLQWCLKRDQEERKRLFSIQSVRRLLILDIECLDEQSNEMWRHSLLATDYTNLITKHQVIEMLFSCENLEEFHLKTGYFHLNFWLKHIFAMRVRSLQSF
jgi:hypothetical protein